jgi:hypothetical protein
VYDLDTVAIGQGGRSEKGTWNNLEIALNGDLSRIKFERGQKPTYVGHRVFVRFTVHYQSHRLSL